MSANPDLPTKKQRILDIWSDVISQSPSGTTLDITEEDKRDVIEERVDAFLESPSPERFETMWRTGYAARQVVAPTPIPEKWEANGRSMDDLVELVQTMRTAETYDPSWEEALSAPGSTREFFGWLHAESQPILNSHLLNTLEFFNISDHSPTDSSFSEQQAAYEAFREVYETVVGHATAGTEWEVPLNVEIYYFSVCVDEANGAIDEEEHDGYRQLFEAVIEAKEVEDQEEVPSPVNDPSEDFWQATEQRQERAQEFLSDPSQERFAAWIDTLPWFVSRFAKPEEIFEETTPDAIAETLRKAVSEGTVEDVLDLPLFGMAAATWALSTIEPDEFIPFDDRAESALQALQFDPPNHNTTSVNNYQKFTENVEAALDQYDLHDFVGEVPSWATDYQVVTCAFAMHDDGRDLSTLVSAAGENSATGQTTSYPETELTQHQITILEQWASVARAESSGAEFDFANHDRTQAIAEYADEFIDDPTPDRFKSMWDRMHSALRRGKASKIWKKWDGSIEELADLIAEIRDAEEYHAEWEDELGGKTTVRELFGSLHIKDYPVLNSAAEQGLGFFGYKTPRSYEDGVSSFEEFRRDYEQIVGHATADAEHGVTVPIRLEIDQLFNVIDKVSEDSIDEESSAVAAELYRLLLQTENSEKKDDTDEDSETKSRHDAVTKPAPYYWVNQGQVEIENEYLRAPTTDLFQYDLPKLEVGDIVFSYNEGEVVGYHEVVEPAQIIEIPAEEANASDSDSDTAERYRVETSFTEFSEPLAFADILPTLWEHRLEQYYPVNPGGINQQYLFNLSEAAGKYLLRRGMGGVEKYDGITEAENDVRERLGEDPDSRDLLVNSLVTSRIEEWTAVLRRNDFVEGSVNRADYTTVSEIRAAYETNKHRLSELATRLGIGSLGDCSPGQVLFIIFFRDLQREAGISENRVNLNHVKLPHILNETYLTEDTIPPVEEPPGAVSDIRRQLVDKGQLVFHGPPGTGKTYTAKQFARWWLREVTEEPRAEQLETVTFHPSFTYEDFIEGLEARERDGVVEYRVQPGIFRKFVDRATAAYEEAGGNEDAPPYLLIIDEINRGNLAQIFGETITLLEQDKRLDADNETTIRLPHSGERFTIPPNLYVIGTMNTADRSIALVDAALRRRFRFVHFPPSIETLCEQYGFSDRDAVRTVAESASDSAKQLLALSICAIDELNRQIRSSPDLGRGKQLGHTTLLGIDQEQPIEDRQQAILDRWHYEIMPMLEEYYFGQFDRIDEELFQGEGERLFDTEAQEIRDFDADDLVTVCSHIVTNVEVNGTTSTAVGD